MLILLRLSTFDKLLDNYEALYTTDDEESIDSGKMCAKAEGV